MKIINILVVFQKWMSNISHINLLHIIPSHNLISFSYRDF